MRRNLSDIKRQNIKVVLGMLFECQHCHIQDRDMERGTVGTPCRACGVPSAGGRMVYSLQTLDLLEMIQATFHAEIPASQHLPGFDTSHREVSALTYACALRETLMTQLLERFGMAKGIAPDELEKVLKKAGRFAYRQHTLLPAWTGKTWDEMVALEASEGREGFESMDRTMARAGQLRNRFLHQGAVYGLVDRAFVTECIDALPALMSFYVALHNRYVRPLLVGA